ncbi:MAG: hypothetical protein QXL01_00390 [Thermoplasmatales archaeon]
MANILDRVTLGEKELLIVDADPSAGSGTPSPIGSSAFWDNGSVGRAYLKVGAGDTDWDQYNTEAVAGTVETGVQNRVGVYPANGNNIDDQLSFSGFLLDIIVASHTLGANRTYTVPDVGASADFVMTRGAQTIAGDKTFNDNVVIQGDLTVNGTVTYVNTTNLNITDKLITLNKGGVANTGGNSGFEIEEDSAIVGYFKSEDSSPTSDAFLMKAPDSFELTMDLAALSADRTVQFQNRNGYVALQQLAGLTQGAVIFVDSNGLLHQDSANLFYDDSTDRLGIGTNTPQERLHVVGNLRVSGLTNSMRLLAESDWRISQATVTTTDATTTTLASIAIPTDSNVMITAHISGRRTGGSAGNPQDGGVYIRTARLKNIAGTVTIHNLQSDFTSEDQAGWNGTIDVSGTNARLRVTGANNNTVLWEATIFTQIVD